jgi:hypothetical protein
MHAARRMNIRSARSPNVSAIAIADSAWLSASA